MSVYFEGVVKKLFESDSGLGKKIIGGVVVGVSLGIGVTWKMNSENPPEEQIGVGGAIVSVLILTTIVTGLVCLFYYRDVVKKRLQNGESVNSVAYLMFGAGAWTVLIWFIVIMPALIIIFCVIMFAFT